MRSLFILNPILIFALLITGSCLKEPFQDSDTLQIEVKNYEEYQMDLGLQRKFDRPDGIVDAIIITQAKHYRKSELEFVVTGLGINDHVVYKYFPKENFIGEDRVKITVCKISECGSIEAKVEIVDIKFTVTE